MAPDVDVLVIGAGLSGLATALGAKRRGASVEVLEAAARPGGAIGTIHRDGALYETGPNSALDTTPLIDALLDATGSRGERVEPSAAAATRYIVRGGELVPLPISPRGMLGTRAFSLAAKLRLAAEPFVAPASPGREESVAAFVRRRLGTEFLDYAVDPFVAGVYAGDPERLSLPAAFPRLHAMEQRYGSLIRGQMQGVRERRQSFSFRNGMQTLTDALARNIERIETSVRVEHVDRAAEDTWVATGTRDGEPIVRRARSVVVAVPAREASALVREIAPAAAHALAAIEYAPVASVATLYRRDDVADPLAGFGFLVPRKEKRQILGSLFSSSMFEHRARQGTVLLTTFVGGMRNRDLLQNSDEEIAAIVRRELRALAGARADPLWSALTRWPRAIPQYELGHLDRLRNVDDAERMHPGLFFCANYRGGISVGDCIKSADAIASAVDASLHR